MGCGVLKARERDAQEAANEAQFEADWDEAEDRYSREYSDANSGYKVCPSRACLRARRCTSDELPCLHLLPVKQPNHVSQSRVEEIYAEIQEQRRDDAEAQAAEESADDVP